MKKKKILALSLALATAMLLPTQMMAQSGLFGIQNLKEKLTQGELFDTQDPTEKQEEYGLFGKGRSANNGMDWQGGGMTPQDPTQEAPLGSGLLILVMAGAGYAIVESKKGKESQQ